MIIVEQIYIMVNLKVPRKFVSEVGPYRQCLHHCTQVTRYSHDSGTISAIPDHCTQVTRYSDILPEDVLAYFQKLPIIIHWDSRYGPYEEDCTTRFNSLDHNISFLSTFKGQILLTTHKTRTFLKQNWLKCYGGVVFHELCNNYSTIHIIMVTHEVHPPTPWHSSVAGMVPKCLCEGT